MRMMTRRITCGWGQATERVYMTMHRSKGLQADKMD